MPKILYTTAKDFHTPHLLWRMLSEKTCTHGFWS